MALYKKTKRLAKLIITLIVLILIFYFSYGYFMQSAYPLKYKKEVLKASGQYKIDKYLILAMIREESRFNKESVSDKGAIGLMQLMPKTATWISSIRGKSVTKKELFKPDINIDHGAWYYSYLSKRYKRKDLALAAYNSGTTVMDRWLAKNPNGNIRHFIYGETRDFVIRVNFSKKTYEKLYEEKDF